MEELEPRMLSSLVRSAMYNNEEKREGKFVIILLWSFLSSFLLAMRSLSVWMNRERRDVFVFIKERDHLCVDEMRV